ncbi:hypothetical protein AB6A40_002133 [Gnathostoma spinigerum]|uniref:Translocon-associated protein subunit alpha n=1 Tax=Gnathostoma spinigerum TaxID=75299 RepID=A0ABD6EDK1_9BILA
MQVYITKLYSLITSIKDKLKTVTMLSSRFVFGFLLLSQMFIVQCNDDADGEVEEEGANDESSVPKETEKETVDEEGESKVGPSPDASVVFIFTQPENSKDLPSGKLVKFLIGFQNRGEKDFIVQSCETSFRYPQDFRYYIQNFTSARYERAVPPKQEATFDYAFFPSEQFAGRPLGLVVQLHYRDSEDSVFMTTVFNETVMIVEDESNFNTETGFLYVIFVSAIILILLAGQHFLSKLTRKHGMTKNRQTPVVETGTNNRNEVDFEWIPRGVLEHNKSPKPGLSRQAGSPRQRKPMRTE